VVMFAMLLGYLPFRDSKDDTKNAREIETAVRKGFEPVKKEGWGAHFPASKAREISPDAMDLISKCLTADPARRLTADEVLNHPWFRSAKDNTKNLDPLVIRGLRQYAVRPRIRQAVLHLMMDTLSEAEVDALQKTFNLMDEDKNGVITLVELQHAMHKAAGSPIQQKEIERIMKTVDVDNNGSLSFEELRFSYLHFKLTRKIERLNAAFQRLDTNHDGRITLDDLRKCVKSYMPETTEEELKKMLDEADEDSDGTIDLDEFLDMMWGNQRDVVIKRSETRKDPS